MADTVQSILNDKGRAIWSVTPDTTVYEAVSMLAEKDVGALLVLDGAKLAGIFSERDYARKVILMGRSSREMQVAEVMTGQLVTVAPETSVEECMRLMTMHRIRHLPVLDRGLLAGVVSIGDLVNSIISAQAETIQQLNNYISGGYPS